MRELILKPGSIDIEVAFTAFEYVEIAKRILLEHRVREFTGADVVKLVEIMEARDRAKRFKNTAGDE